MICRIVLDADGVLMDMVGAAAEYFKRSAVEFYKAYPKGNYRLHEALGMTKQDCWKALDSVKFWKTVCPYVGAREFVNNVLRLANQHYAKVVIATQATKDPLTAGVKMLGLSIFRLPTYVIWNGKKDPFADGQTLLVDDCAANCDRWVGPSIEFPQPWNSRHKEAPVFHCDPNYPLVLDEIRKELEL